MDKRKKSVFIKLYLVLFVILNLVNAFLLLAPGVLSEMHPYDYDLLMLAGSLIGNMAVLGLFCGIGFMLFKKEKSIAVYLLVITGILSLFCFGLGVFYNYYGMMFGFSALANFATESGGDSFAFVLRSLPSVLKLGAPIFFLSFLLLLASYIVFAVLIRKKKLAALKYPKRNVKSGLLLSLCCLLLVVGLNLTYNSVRNNTCYKYAPAPQLSAQYQGVYAHYLAEAGEQLLPDKKISAADQKAAFKAMDAYYKPYHFSLYDNIFEGRNLLLIQMESINNFLIGLKVKNNQDEMVEVTPYLNEMVRNGYYFANFYTSVGIGNTSDAEFSAMTGLYPSGSYYTVFKNKDNDFETLPKLFREKDYRAISFHGNKGSFYNRSTNHVASFGFERHYGKEDMEALTPDRDLAYVGRWVADEELFQQAIAQIKSANAAGEKVFCFAITISNHTPFVKPKNAVSDSQWFANVANIFTAPVTLDQSKVFSKIYRGYLEYAHYTDYAIGSALKELADQNLLDHTVIICYGDHGIVAPIYNMFYNYPEMFANEFSEVMPQEPDKIARKLTEAEYLNKIPFIVYAPDIKANAYLPDPETFFRTRSEASIKTTVAHLFGLEEKFSFNADCFDDRDEVCYNPKSNVIYTDKMIMAYGKNDYLLFDPDQNACLLRRKLLAQCHEKRALNEMVRDFNLEDKYLQGK